MTIRHKARITALQALYEIDSVGREPADAVAHLLKENVLPEENEVMVRNLVEGVGDRKKEIDGYISEFAPTWPIDQISCIDRNILRLAIFEVLFDNKVPMKVAVSEAVYLARSFGSDTSAKFVNGVLGSVCKATDREGFRGGNLGNGIRED